MKYKSTVSFPEKPFLHTEDDIVAIGGKLDIGTLYNSYRNGIFPWPHKDYPMLWFFPKKRGVLRFDEFHIPKSLAKFAEKKLQQVRITMNQNFPLVIDECRFQKRPNQDGTWILPEIKRAYIEMHFAGYAHSIECWEGDELVGGIYGILIENVFSGESMFHKKTNMGKLCLIYLVEWLKSLGIKWMDIQMVTPVLESFGGKYISDEAYYRLLRASQK